ncbi:MAG: 2Fe-2S iron-sulfur cluster-binding protein, partial [Usitatibacter sp.]
MYVIVTSKPGLYRSEAGAGFSACELYDYVFCGRLRARFLIAQLQGPARVRIVEDKEGGAVNDVPAKFLPTFKTIEAARADLEALTRFGDLDARLERRPLPEATPAPAAAPAQVHITFVPQGDKRVSAPHNSNLLRVSLREKGGIPFKCGGGLCGTCKCRILRGIQNTDAVKPKERKHLNEEQLAQGYRMACQTFV